MVFSKGELETSHNFGRGRGLARVVRTGNFNVCPVLGHVVIAPGKPRVGVVSSGRRPEVVHNRKIVWRGRLNGTIQDELLVFGQFLLRHAKDLAEARRASLDATDVPLSMLTKCLWPGQLAVLCGIQLPLPRCLRLLQDGPKTAQ